MKHFIINYKTYPQASGANAVSLTEALINANIPTDWQLVVCPQAADVYRIREKFPHAQIWAQHVDAVEPGKNTGWTTFETMMMAGITGTLINHAEHPLTLEQIRKTIEMARANNIFSCVAAASEEMALQIAELKPDMIAYEPPTLIGTGVSLMTTDPAEAVAFVEKLGGKDINLCLGAGISSHEDVDGASKIGYDSILLASAITTSSTPGAKLLELVKGENAQ
jgi:triosephosphate isomerase